MQATCTVARKMSFFLLIVGNRSGMDHAWNRVSIPTFALSVMSYSTSNNQAQETSRLDLLRDHAFSKDFWKFASFYFNAFPAIKRRWHCWFSGYA